MLNRPVRGLNGYDPKAVTEHSPLVLPGEVEISTIDLNKMGEEIKMNENEVIGSAVSGLEAGAIDITGSMIKAPITKYDNSSWDGEVVGFLSMMILLSIVFYVLRKMNEMRTGPRYDKSDSFGRSTSLL